MTVAMGVVSNLPLALAPGMGLNAVVAFQRVGAAHLSYAEARRLAGVPRVLRARRLIAT
jgi:xanthine/uracil/vitamin C permease (AzgA family)